MNIVVCSKPVYDTSLIRVDQKSGTLITRGVPYKLNDYDIYALELIAQTIKKTYNTHVTAVGIGNRQGLDALREAIARGADEAIYVEADADYDPLSYAKMFADVIKSVKYDMIVCGSMSEDFMWSSFLMYLSKILNIPSVTNIVEIISISSDKVVVKRKTDVYIETYELKLPAILGVTSGAVTPRAVTQVQILRVPRDKVKIVKPQGTGTNGYLERKAIKPVSTRQRKGIFVDADKEPEKAAELLIGVLKENMLL